jgi:hypothetical protein
LRVRITWLLRPKDSGKSSDASFEFVEPGEYLVSEAPRSVRRPRTQKDASRVIRDVTGTVALRCFVETLVLVFGKTEIEYALSYSE